MDPEQQRKFSYSDFGQIGIAYGKLETAVA